MIKKISFLAFCSFVLFLTGCSSSQDVGSQFNRYDDYVSLFMEIVDESNKMLATYSTNPDKLYTKQMSEEQFGAVVRNLIPDSNNQLARLDEHLYKVDPSLFDFHRGFMGWLNSQHQMFLQTVDMVNDENRKVDKSRLTQEHLSIKQEQTKMVEHLKHITMN